MGAVITLKAGVVGDAARRFNAAVDFELRDDEHLAIVGPNGSGKTILAQTISGGLFLRSGTLEFGFRDGSASPARNICYASFADAYGSEYYQQRWNASDIDGLPTVCELFDGRKPSGKAFESLGLDAIWDKRAVMLSTGELRKFHIARMLVRSPQVLILENPYIGLDAGARRTVTELLTALGRSGTVNIVLVVTSVSDIPEFITGVYEVRNMTCSAKYSAKEYLASTKEEPLEVLRDVKLPCGDGGEHCGSDEIISMRNVTVEYAGRTILDKLNWVVRRGEKWSLSGANGSGKSTLLGLVCADNPQAYSQDMSLFGRRRGTGESIWDIKRRIGYLSSEMHRSYMRDIPAVDIVASGFFDTVGLYVRPTEYHRAQCEAWLDVFCLGHLRDCSFVKLSFGQQRMLLLARALVKNPELLILDEPMHGLDPHNKRLALSVIEAYAAQAGKTMIYVTHYEEELPSCINRFLHLGK